MNFNSFKLSNFFEENNKSSLLGKAWSISYNCNKTNLMNYFNLFSYPLEFSLINLCLNIFELIEFRYIDDIISITKKMEDFCNKGSLLWQIHTNEFKPDKSKIDYYKTQIKIEEDTLNIVLNQKIKIGKSVSDELKKLLAEVKSKIEKIIEDNEKDITKKKLLNKKNEIKKLIDSIKSKEAFINSTKIDFINMIDNIKDEDLSDNTLERLEKNAKFLINLEKNSFKKQNNKTINWNCFVKTEPEEKRNKNLVLFEIIIWYSKLISIINWINESLSERLMEGILKLNNYPELKNITIFLLNIQESKELGNCFSQENLFILYSTINSLLILRMINSQLINELFNLNAFINSFKKRIKFNDENFYFIYNIKSYAEELPDDFKLYLPKFQPYDIFYLFLNILKNNGENKHENFSLGPMLNKFEISQAKSKLISMFNEIKQMKYNNMIDYIIELSIILFNNIFDAEKNIKKYKNEIINIYNERLSRNKECLRHFNRNNQLKQYKKFNDENEIIKEILLLFKVSEEYDENKIEYNDLFEDLSFLEMGKDLKNNEDLFNNYPSLMFYLYKNLNITNYIKSKYSGKKLYENSKFHYSFYFWIFVLRIFSSINCINFDCYEKYNNYSIQTIQNLIISKLDKKEKIGKRWFNYVFNSVPFELENFNDIQVFQFIKKVLLLLKQIDERFYLLIDEEMKKILNELFTYILSDNLEELFQKNLNDNTDSLIKFLNNPNYYVYDIIKNFIKVKYNLLLNDVKYIQFKKNYLSLFSNIDNSFSEFKESYLNQNQTNFEKFKLKKENEKKTKAKNLEEKLINILNEYKILFEEITKIKEENIIIKFNIFVSKEKEKSSETYTVKDLESFYIEINKIKTLVSIELAKLEEIRIKNSEQNEMNKYLEKINNKISEFSKSYEKVKTNLKNKNKYISDLYINILISYEINIYNKLFNKLYQKKVEVEGLLKQNIELLYDKSKVFRVLNFIYSCQSKKKVKRKVFFDEDEEMGIYFDCLSSDNYYLFKESGNEISNPRIIYYSTQDKDYYYVRYYNQFICNNIEFYMLKEEKIKDIINLQINSINKISYINEFPCLEFGTVTIVKFEDICNYLSDFINKFKNIKNIIDNLEKDKEKNEMNGIKNIYNQINNFSKEIESNIDSLNQFDKIQYSGNSNLECETIKNKFNSILSKLNQFKIDNSNFIFLLKNSDLLNLMKQFQNLNRENIIANDLKLILPTEKEINKSINFSNIDPNSDSLSKPIINQDKNKITCFCPQKKFIFGPFFPSSYNAPIEINFISFIKNLEVEIIPKEKDKYSKYFEKFVDNANNYVKINIKIPDLENTEKEMEEHLIETKIIFSSQSLEKCETDFEFKFIIIPLYYFISCPNYKLAKYNDGLILYCQKLFSNSRITLIIKNYNYNEEPKYQIDISSLDKNNCEKPIIIKDKHNKDHLYIDVINEDEKIKFLNCLLNIKFNDEFNIPLYIQSYIIPFMFEFEVYNYNLKEYSNEIEIYITRNDLPIKNYKLHCQFIMPDIFFNSSIDIYSNESPYLEIIDKEKIFNEIKSKPLSNFSFDLDINISDKIVKIININEDYTYNLNEFYIYLEVANIKKFIKILIKKPPQFVNFNGYNSHILGIPLYKYNSNKKGWEKIQVNSEYNSSELHINSFGLAQYFEIDYRDNNVTLININQNLNKFISFEYLRKDYRLHHFINFKLYKEQYTISLNSDSSKAFLIGVYDMKYWYPLLIDYPKELENYKLLEYLDDNNDLAEVLINKLEKLGKSNNNFMNMATILFKIRNLRIQNENENLRDLLNEFLSHLPLNSIDDIEGFRDLLDQVNLNEGNITLKLYNTVII